MGSFVSPAPVDVAAANAAIPVGAVGSYMLLGKIGGGGLLAGALLAGSSLRHSNTYNYNGNGNYGQGLQTAAGTWKLCGQIGYYNGGAYAGGVMMSVSTWVRVA